jgi:hypothetical protein
LKNVNVGADAGDDMHIGSWEHVFDLFENSSVAQMEQVEHSVAENSDFLARSDFLVDVDSQLSVVLLWQSCDNLVNCEPLLEVLAPMNFWIS